MTHKQEEQLRRPDRVEIYKYYEGLDGDGVGRGSGG